MKPAKKKRHQQALAVSDNDLNSDAEIEEKRYISDLRAASYANQGNPDVDDKVWWAESRREVRRILKEAGQGNRPPATLFLRLHYPFFDVTVQSVLMERHPEKNPNIKNDPWYPVNAYLLAEQYVMTAYSDDPLGSTELYLIGGAAQMYFALDLHWFASLLVSMADAVKIYKNAKIPELTSWQARLQGWNNIYSNADKTPTEWFKGTEYLAAAKAYNLKNLTKNKMSSVTVIASRENNRRLIIFQPWLPCWQSNLQRLDGLLNSTPAKP